MATSDPAEFAQDSVLGLFATAEFAQDVVLGLFATAEIAQDVVLGLFRAPQKAEHGQIGKYFGLFATGFHFFYQEPTWATNHHGSIPMKIRQVKLEKLEVSSFTTTIKPERIRGGIDTFTCVFRECLELSIGRVCFDC